MFKILFSLISVFLLISPSWAYLTAGKVAVTATSSSSGVSSTSQDSDISDAVGTSVSVGVPVAVTGNMNITGTYQVNGTPISATSNWNQSGSTINYTAGNVGIGSATPGQVLDVQGTIRATGLIAPYNYIKIANNQAQNTGGGTATSGSWIIVPLNTIVTDTASNVVSNSSSSGFVLSAGTYDVWATEPFSLTNISQIQLYNTTGSAILITGDTIYSASNANTQMSSTLRGRFTVAAGQTLQLQYQVGSTSNTSGLGVAGNYGPEVYGQITMYKVI